MTGRYSEDEAIAAVATLTRTQLVAFVEAEIIVPLHTENGIVFRQVDLVRMELLCELTESFSLNDDALSIIISLIDQLHSTRGELDCLLQAIRDEPADVRERLGHALLNIQNTRKAQT
jgi:chaperone modulatory protein CbpM